MSKKSKRSRGWGWAWGWRGFFGGLAAMLLKTGQTTCYSVFDDGDEEIGIAKGYTALTTGDYTGNVNIEVAHYAAATISFDSATKKIADSADGLVTVLTDDTIVVKGSTDNDGTYTVATGGVAGEIVTTEALVEESAAAVVSIYKVAVHSNNAVDDRNTGLQWCRNNSVGERVGPTSNGQLNWYDVAVRFAIYAGANTVSLIMPGNIIRVIGGAALTQFHVGDMIMCAGFANPDNLFPNMYVVSATPNGADLDIVVDPGNEVLIAEGAVGDTIYLNCRSIYNYMAGARSAGLSNLTDWRVADAFELYSLVNLEAPNAVPDPVAFPGWGTAAQTWTSTTRPNLVANAFRVSFLIGSCGEAAKTLTEYCALVRT